MINDTVNGGGASFDNSSVSQSLTNMFNPVTQDTSPTFDPEGGNQFVTAQLNDIPHIIYKEPITERYIFRPADNPTDYQEIKEPAIIAQIKSSETSGKITPWLPSKFPATPEEEAQFELTNTALEWEAGRQTTTAKGFINFVTADPNTYSSLFNNVASDNVAAQTVDLKTDIILPAPTHEDSNPVLNNSGGMA